MFINSNLPEEVVLLTFSGGDHLYSERNRIPSDSTMAQPVMSVTDPGDEQQVFQDLHQMGISHILLDKNHLKDDWLVDVLIVQKRIIDRWYYLEYEDDDLLYTKSSGKTWKTNPVYLERW
jgi:hypothetical protein